MLLKEMLNIRLF